MLSSAAAHEFWIEPLSYRVNVGEKIQAHLKNGQNFKGITYSFVNEIFTRFEMATPAGLAPVEGRRGDRPALNVEGQQGGVHVALYSSTMQWVRYKKFDKFEAFVREKKLDWVLSEHTNRGYPTENITETYYRHAKSLIAVGRGEGQDRLLGQPIEFVALSNPYTSDAKDGVDVQLFLEGQPLANTDIQIFHFPEKGTTAVENRVMTDRDGKATIPPYNGGPFLINAVDIREPRAEGVEKGASWETIWATLTYELPSD